MKMLKSIRQQIESTEQKPKFVVLDHDTWAYLRSNMGQPEVRAAVWLGQEQKNPLSTDKILGVPVAIVTGNGGTVVQVVV